MSFDWIEHTTGLFHKIKFCFVCGKIFSLLSHFLIAKDYELSKSTRHLVSVPLTLKCVLIYLFFHTSIVSLMMFCVGFLSELIILLSIHDVTNHLTCRNKMR